MKSFRQPVIESLPQRGEYGDIDDDRATGGIDLQRGIYSIIKLATASGMETVAEREIETVYRALIAERSGGNS